MNSQNQVKQSSIGIASSIIAISGFLFLLLGALIWTNVIPQKIVPEIILLIILVGHYQYGLVAFIAGTVLAIIGLTQKQYKKTYSIIGLIFSLSDALLLIYISFFTSVKRLL